MRKKRFVLLFSPLVLGLTIGGTMWRSANSFAQYPVVEMPPDGDSEMQLDSIDEKALQAKDNDESSVRELADAVFAAPEFAVIPTADREAMKERVLSAELDYRSGQGEGIVEENIVETVNELADKFSAPDYARTSALQVRVLRAGLMNRYPNFIAQEHHSGETRPEVNIGDSISPTMSPLEAVFVTGGLLWQKMVNEYFQYTPQEWVDKVYKKALEQWQADLAGNSVVEQSSEPARHRLVIKENNEKCNRMMQSVITGAATLLSSDSENSAPPSNLYDATLNTLGIKQ
jgi:hypothetical protein